MQSRKSNNKSFLFLLISLLVVGWLVVLGIKLHGRSAMINEIIDDSIEYADTYINKGDYFGAENMLNSIKETQTSNINIRRLDIKLAEIEKLAEERKNELREDSSILLEKHNFSGSEIEYVLNILDAINVYGILEMHEGSIDNKDLDEISNRKNLGDSKYSLYELKVMTRRGYKLKIEVVCNLTSDEDFSIVEIEMNNRILYDDKTSKDIDEFYKNNLI